MKDRQPSPGKAGRVTLTLDDGTVITGKLARADEPIVPGMLLDKAHVVPDEVANTYRLTDPSPAEVFMALAPSRFGGQTLIATSGAVASGQSGQMTHEVQVYFSVISDPLETARKASDGQYWYVIPPMGTKKVVVRCMARWGEETFARAKIKAKFGSTTKESLAPPAHSDGSLENDTVFFTFDVTDGMADRYLSFLLRAEADNTNGTIHAARVYLRSFEVDFL